jgi:hypothetical protein
MRTITLAGFTFAVAAAGCSANDDIPAPELGSIVPSQAAGGAIVAISGSYLCQEPSPGSDEPGFQCNSDGVISFGQTPATATTDWTDTGVMVEVPSIMSGSVSVTATMNGITSNSISFTIEAD